MSRQLTMQSTTGLGPTGMTGLPLLVSTPECGAPPFAPYSLTWVEDNCTLDLVSKLTCVVAVGCPHEQMCGCGVRVTD